MSLLLLMTPRPASSVFYHRMKISTVPIMHSESSGLVDQATRIYLRKMTIFQNSLPVLFYSLYK